MESKILQKNGLNNDMGMELFLLGNFVIYDKKCDPI